MVGSTVPEVSPQLRIAFRILCIIVAASLGMIERAAAQDQLALLRDAEIESTIRIFSRPIWKSAGLDPQAIRIYIVNDPTLNSFIDGGQNLFMNTSTILLADKPNQLIRI